VGFFCCVDMLGAWFAGAGALSLASNVYVVVVQPVSTAVVAAARNIVLITIP
jgi:hypothetical protein